MAQGWGNGAEALRAKGEDGVEPRRHPDEDRRRCRFAAAFGYVRLD